MTQFFFLFLSGTLVSWLPDSFIHIMDEKKRKKNSLRPTLLHFFTIAQIVIKINEVLGLYGFEMSTRLM